MSYEGKHMYVGGTPIAHYKYEQGFGGNMRTLLLIVLSMSAVGCGKVNFDNDKLEEIKDIIDNGIDLGGGDDDDDSDDDLYCPRYDLVVKSTHASNKKLNYKFTFNAEVKQKSTEGEIKIKFLQNSNSVNYTQCSGKYSNTSILPNLKPLQAVEALTAEIEITHGISCPTVMPERTTYLEVIDSATNTVVWDEKELIDYIGSCEFGYSDVGVDLRDKIMKLSDGVAKEMADACNK